MGVPGGRVTVDLDRWQSYGRSQGSLDRAAISKHIVIDSAKKEDDVVKTPNNKFELRIFIEKIY